MLERAHLVQPTPRLTMTGKNLRLLPMEATARKRNKTTYILAAIGAPVPPARAVNGLLTIAAATYLLGARA